MGLKAPFGWVGGKSKLAPTIVKRLPDHRLYCEVFAGALSVLYAKEPSKIEVVNDLNGDLVNLHTQIRLRPVSLSNYLRRLFYSREIFYAIRDGKYRWSNDIERAACYLYKIYFSFSANLVSFAMPKKRVRKAAYRDFLVCSKRLRHVCIERMDFARLIKEYDSDDTLFYADPPYYGTENYYEAAKAGGFGKGDHIRLRDALAGAKGLWLLSYNDCEAIRELYAGYKIEAVTTRYVMCGARHKQASELLISNY